MDKLALILAVVALGVGGYSLFGRTDDDSFEPASVQGLESLRVEVTALRVALSDEQAAHAETSTRLESLEALVEPRAKRLKRLEAEAVEAREADDAGEPSGDSLTQKQPGKVEPAKESNRLQELEEALARLEARTSEPGDHIETREITIVTAEGQPAVRLGTTEYGAGSIEVFAKNGERVATLFGRSDDDGELRLHDEAGVLRATMGGNDDGGYANFYGKSGGLAAYVGADADKPNGYVAVYGEDRQEVVGLYANDEGGVVAVRNRETTNQVAWFGASPSNGMGYIGLGTSEGDPALALFCTENGGQMKALNADGEAAAFLGVSADPAGNGLLYVSRVDGQRISEVGANAAGGGYMSFNNGDNERVLFLGASTGTAPDDGVLEVSRKGGKLGVVLRAYLGGSSVRVYDSEENVIQNLR